MTDLYTRIVLTVIAAALTVIAIRGPFVTSAAAIGDSCGDSALNPCHVDVTNRQLRVLIDNIR